MESNLTDNWVPLETAVSHYDLAYGGEIELYEGLELAWKCVKNHIRYFRTVDCVLDAAPCEGRVDLAPDAFMVHSVTAIPHGTLWLAPPSALITSGVSFPRVEGVDYGVGTLIEPRWLEVTDLARVETPGAYVPFDFGCGHVTVARDVPVRVVFSRLKLDKEGYPFITEKTAEACAAYFHKLDVMRRYYRKEADINMKREAERDFNAAAAVARTGDGFSENTMDAVLTAMTSMGRKRHDQPYDPS